MSSTLDSVRAALKVFMRGGAFMPLSSAVLEATDVIDADPDITDDDREWFDELYDAVYMAAEDPLDAASAKLGMVGAAELRAQLRDMRLDRDDS